MGRDLDYDGDPVLNLLIGQAYRCYCLSLAAPSPLGRDVFEAMRRPEVGDLVVEVSTIYRPILLDNARIGKLLRVASEPICKPEEWEDEGPIPEERVWYVRSLADNEEHRWVNASFIRIPTSRTLDEMGSHPPHPSQIERRASANVTKGEE